MKLSSEEERLVLDNQNLVHFVLKRLNVVSAYQDYEDMVSMGTIGLIKAAITYDSSQNVTFSTYATRCISNEILMYFRNNKKHRNDVSIYTTIGYGDKDKELTLLDTFVDPKSNFEEKIIQDEEYIKMIKIILNCLQGRQRIILLYQVAGFTQIEIAKKMNISRSYVSTIENSAIKELRRFLSPRLHYKEVFSMEIVGDEYKITFSSKDVPQFNKVFANVLANLSSYKELPDFKVDNNQEQVIIHIPASPDSFAFIALIIQEIDNFSITYVSNKSKIHADEEKNINFMGIKSDQLKQISNFIKSNNYFTLDDLKTHFADFDTQVIYNALYKAQQKGIINIIGKGEYILNKKN